MLFLIYLFNPLGLNKSNLSLDKLFLTYLFYILRLKINLSLDKLFLITLSYYLGLKSSLD